MDKGVATMKIINIKENDNFLNEYIERLNNGESLYCIDINKK